MMGEDLIQFYKEKIKKEWEIAFLAAFLGCLLVHIFKFTNTLPNHDSLFNVYADQNVTGSGRWFLQYACGISSYFDLPWMNGLLCAVYLGLTASIVAETLDMKNPVVIVLSSLVLVTTISTTETLFFEFTADGYLLALMMCALAAYLGCKGNRWYHYTIGGMCICLSLAVYQAYLSFAVVLSVCYLVIHMLNEGMDAKAAWNWIGKNIVIYGTAMAGYFVLWKLILAVTGIPANDYQGISEVGTLRLTMILSGAVESVKNLLLFFLEWNILEHPITLYAVLNILFLLCFVFIVIAAIVKSGIWKKKAVFLTLLVCLIACVPVISIWRFLSDGVQYRPMMMHSVSLLYILAIVLFDKWACKRTSTAFGLLIALICFNCSVMANISYFYLDKCYERSNYMGSQMMERIVQVQEEYGEEIESIAFIGNRAHEVALINSAQGNKIPLLGSVIETDFLYDHTHAYLYMCNTYNLGLPAVSYEDRQALAATDAVRNMDVWPVKDSVKIVDGVLVIKLADSVK